ncbi:MAG: acetylornithine carbamoyltransferase [Bacteroidota bacterium]
MQKFISAHDVSDIDQLILKALQYKANPLQDQLLGKGKRLGLIFLNPSLRTRISTQVAAENLGMSSMVFNVGSEGWQWEFEDGVVMNGHTVEHIKDAAHVLGQYFDVLAFRTFPSLTDKTKDYSEHAIHQLIKYSGLPVISLESATLHPLQSLADLITISENISLQKKLKIVLTWAQHIKPIPQCVANSFAQWVNKWNKAEFIITHPTGYELDDQFTNGSTIEYNQQKALEGADFVYVKNWSSYKEYGKVLCNDTSWMLTNESWKRTNKAGIMHCLPVRRNVELSDAMLDSDFSLVTQQAGNRVWAAQAVLAEILKTRSTK